MDSWESGDFAQKANGVQIATSLAIAVSVNYKYQNQETELWSCVTSMLKSSLRAQQAQTNKAVMDSFDFSRLVGGLSVRLETDPELWAMISKELVSQMNKKSLKALDIMHVTRSLVNAKIRSD